MEISKQDWKLYREKLPLWQESYMAKLNAEYIELLNGSGNSSDKFWALEKRIKQDRRHLGVITEVSKKTMIPVIANLMLDEVIEDTDLREFNEEIREAIHLLVSRLQR